MAVQQVSACLGIQNCTKSASRCGGMKLKASNRSSRTCTTLCSIFAANMASERAIAAPQIGAMKRIVYMYISSPTVFFNPVIDQQSSEMITMWDDCMCFPDLVVKVRRHRVCRITFLDRDWQEQTMLLEEDLSELLQHECDHLDGVLATSRAIDARSFALRSQQEFLA